MPAYIPGEKYLLVLLGETRTQSRGSLVVEKNKNCWLRLRFNLSVELGPVITGLEPLQHRGGWFLTTPHLVWRFSYVVRRGWRAVKHITRVMGFFGPKTSNSRDGTSSKDTLAYKE